MGYSYFEYSRPFATGAMDVGVGILFGMLAVVLLVSLLVGVAFYVLRSLGCYSIAKRRGIHHPWLAWIPVGNVWILGSISDQYQYVSKGKVRNRRKVLMGMTIAMYALMLPVCIAEIAMVVQMITGYGINAIGVSVMIVVCSVLLSVLTIVVSVFKYIAYYDLFSSCQPGNNVLYLVLSILFSVTLPIFVFVCRNKDEGMPPRKQPRSTAARQLMEEIEKAEEDPVLEEDFVPDEEPEE